MLQKARFLNPVPATASVTAFCSSLSSMWRRPSSPVLSVLATILLGRNRGRRHSGARPSATCLRLVAYRVDKDESSHPYQAGLFSPAPKMVRALGRSQPAEEIRMSTRRGNDPAC